MSVAWGVVVAVLLGAMAGTLNDEIRGRLDRLPRALLRLAGRRLPEEVRADLTEEWRAELEAILKRAEGLPVTRLIEGTRYALGLLRAAPGVADELAGAPSRSLPRLAWVYVAGVVTLTTGLLATSSFGQLEWGTLAGLVVLYMVCNSALLINGHPPTSLGLSVSLAAVVMLGPVGAALVGLGSLAAWQHGVRLEHRVFNGAMFALTGYASGVIFTALGGQRTVPGDTHWAGDLVVPFLGALVTFVAVNLLLVTGILVLSRQATWRDLSCMGQIAACCLGFGTFGLLIAVLWHASGPFSAVLGLLPVLIARWVSTRPLSLR